jgi:hypothetical protein
MNLFPRKLGNFGLVLFLTVLQENYNTAWLLLVEADPGVVLSANYIRLAPIRCKIAHVP